MTDTGDTAGTEDDALRSALTRLVQQLLRDEERTEQRGTNLMPVLDQHFGRSADEIPVVLESIDGHRFVDVDIALDEIAGRDPVSRLLGIGGGDQRHHSSLSDLMAQAEWGRFREGQVDRLNLATGPDTDRATVASVSYTHLTLPTN